MVSRILIALASLFAFVFAAFALSPAAAQDGAAQNGAGDSILVIDASGSMWGQIEGEAKIVIAKHVLGDLLKDLPAERRLGLVAYGHRRTGDCADIEELAAVGAERAAISGAVANLNPKGKTPMADAIKLAAEKLQYTENKATVILVSDGIETCVPDPCGVAAALEQAGADFTAHVIGFDVTEENAQAQLRCIAENTGGVFVSAENAADLGAALQETVIEAAEAPPPAANLYLRATELEGGLVIEEGLNWRVVPAAGGDPAVAQDNAGVLESTVAPGAYDVSVVRPSDGLKGEAKGVVVQPNAQKTVTIALTFPVEATVRLEPAGSAVAGTNIKVFFTGPERQGDYIQLSEKGGEGYKTYAYVNRGNPAELRMPVEPGEYEVSYMLGRPLRALASAPITATPASATLDAPDTAIAGETVTVDFTGPPAGPSDWITVVSPDAPDNKYLDYYYTTRDSPATLRMPLEAGVYELRYVQGGESVLARKPITVTAALATLDAPEKAGAGETVKIAFTGPPAGSGDWITVVEPSAPDNKYTDYFYITRGSPGELRMPLEPGAYELRYVQGGSKVLVRRMITVETVPASLKGPSEAIAGETIKIEFSGPAAGSSDWITITEPDAEENKYLDYYYATRGSPAELRTPFDGGAYELRYVQAGKKVIARQPIAIREVPATLDAPASVKAGEEFEVAFTGPPAGSSDYITVSAAGSDDLKYLEYAYAVRGSPVKLKMPKEPGDYELRYIQGGKKLLARQPIKAAP